MTKLLPLAPALLLSACAVGPDYRAKAPEPAAIANVDGTREIATPFGVRWWEQFGDPVLDSLISQASYGNLDLRQAEARLRAARAMVRDSESNLIPTIDAQASYDRTDAQEPGLTTDRVAYNAYQAGFDANWEIDIFGGQRRRVEAAKADRGAELASLRDAQVSLFAEVARNYFALRGLQDRIDILKANIRNQQDTVRLTETRLAIGTNGEQDAAAARARLQEVVARLPTLEAEEQSAEFRLAVLLGKRPGEIGIDLAPKAIPPINRTLPIGDTGDVLGRRPDVQRAERALAAATARIGVAKADFFPHLSVSGFLGFISSRAVDFGSGSSQAYSITPGISWPGLNIERARARLHAAQARADAADAAYSQTVLLAIEDLDNAVTGYNAFHARYQAVAGQVVQSRRAADLARLRYQNGSTSFLELLDAERVQLSAQNDLAQAQASVNQGAVAIYKALGGGWQACGDEHCSQLASATHR